MLMLAYRESCSRPTRAWPGGRGALTRPGGRWSSVGWLALACSCWWTPAAR